MIESADETPAGFVILSHNHPLQLLRLVQTLNALYDSPPIAVHHDFAQTSLSPEDYPTNCRFVQPSLATSWGTWSLCAAMLAALRMLYVSANPRFFFFVSAADYPTMNANAVLDELSAIPADALIDHFDLELALLGKVEVGDPHLAHHRQRHNVELERDHYLRVQLKLPLIRFRAPPYSTSKERYPRVGRATFALPVRSPFMPFDDSYRCFVGSQWFTGNRRIAANLLNPSAKDRALHRAYSRRVLPDETFVQTIICNDPELQADSHTRRFAIWEGAHPRPLGVEDFEAIVGSSAHFARKFRPDDPVLDLLDVHLGISRG